LGHSVCVSVLCIQALDEEHLKVDAQFGGVDQRKIFVFAEKVRQTSLHFVFSLCLHRNINNISKHCTTGLVSRRKTRRLKVKGLDIYIPPLTRKPCYCKDDHAMHPICKLFTLILFTLMATILCADVDSE